MSGFLMSSVNLLVEKLIDPLLNHVSYTICVGDYVDALDDEVEKLKLKKKDTKEQVEIAERAGKEATNEVKGWFKTSEQLEEEANSIKCKFRNRKCKFCGTHSFNCISNHSIGTRSNKAKKKVEKELRRIIDFREVARESTPPAVQAVCTTMLPESSRYEIELKLDMALNFLRNDGKGALGIWGMGGVGKTTLLHHINNALAKDPSSGFDRVVLVTVSKDCTIKRIRKLIVKEMKLESEEENHKTNIYNYLSNKNFVILLDDLWARLDLLEVGIPPLGTVGEFKHKLIMTTRDKQVCYDMDVRQTMKVDCLSGEAARLLFREKVGEEAINSHPLIPRLADKVADECGGLPMALICIARAMAGKWRVNLWEKAIEDLKMSKLSMVPGMEDPLPLLKVSYDYLKNPRMQECLLLCALWPEDYKIPRYEIIQCWMGHGLLGEFDSVDQAYNNGDGIIDSLEKASLLQWSEDENYISGEGYVSLHDLIRDMALWIACDCGANEKKWMVLDKAPQDEKSWCEANKMSLMDNELSTLPINIYCDSHLVTLVLQDNDLSEKQLGILQNFRALTYLDLSYNTRIKNVPIEICLLDKLEYLNLSFTRITGLPDDLKNLKSLKYLLLQGTYISEVSSQLLSSLACLEMLDLSNNASHVAQSLIIGILNCLKGHLKSLGINACSESDLNELARLPSLPIRTLCIHVESTKNVASLDLLPPCDWSKLNELDLSGGDNPNVQELVIDEKHLLFPECLRIHLFNGLQEIIWKSLGRKEMFPRIRYVYIGHCHKLKHVSWLANLPLLEHLRLNFCENLQQVVLEDVAKLQGKHKPVFPTLKFLFMYGLKKLDTFCNHPLAFPSLEKLVVSHCRELKKLPFDSFTSCSKLRKIVGEEEWWEDLDLDDNMRSALQPLTLLTDSSVLTMYH